MATKWAFQHEVFCGHNLACSNLWNLHGVRPSRFQVVEQAIESIHTICITRRETALESNSERHGNNTTLKQGSDIAKRLSADATEPLGTVVDSENESAVAYQKT